MVQPLQAAREWLRVDAEPSVSVTVANMFGPRVMRIVVMDISVVTDYGSPNDQFELISRNP